MSNENANLTKVIVPCRFSYLHCWEPNAVSDGDPKYSVSAIIPKSDTETIEKIKKAIEQAKKDSVSKWGGKVPANLKLPLRDGDIDRPEDEAYSTLPETYDVLMTGAKANLVVTDPPYNVDYEGSAGKIKNDHMENEQFYNFLFAAFVNMEQHMESDASIYVFHADTEGLNFRKAFQAAGFYLSGCCIWKKQSLVLGRSPYQWQHEPCLFGWKKGGKHNLYSDRKQTTIWEFDRPKKSESHPTSKPVGLVAPCRIRFPSSLPMRLLEIMRRSWLGLPPLMKISLHPSSNAM